MCRWSKLCDITDIDRKINRYICIDCQIYAILLIRPSDLIASLVLRLSI